MRRHLLTLPIVTAAAFALGARSESMGAFEDHQDVGGPAIAGSASYDKDAQRYTIAAAGANMWGARDEFHVVWRRMSGDFILTANASFIGDGVDPHRKLGWIVRAGLDPAAAYVDAAVHGDGLTSLQFRRSAGAETAEVRSAVAKPDVVQLERHGRTYTMSVARFGEPFARTGIDDVDLGGGDVYVGLFVCSHDPKVTERATFHNVRITVPPKEGWQAYRDYIGSNLELMTVDDGARTVIHTAPGSIQAPNWTRDGRALIYNGGGRLYRFDLASRTETAIDTGTVASNNNDHVISFDGRTLGISSSSREDRNQSVVFTVPVEGGTPKRITEGAPSYLHGWSPDGKYLVFTGRRNEDFDVYRIPSEGGGEVRLTTAPGLDDGPEYSPDGRWIYFNSARTGRMQIWRMRPDGSGQEQLTKGELNDWFPHVSPDGSRMIFVSFLPDVKPDDHPFYKQVYLRTMRPDGSDPRVVAYVYGGQGTMNVPSWSPDGKRVAFVSNSALTAPH